MLYIVKKIYVKSKDPPRPCQQAKIKSAFMRGQVSFQAAIQPRREAYILETSTSFERHTHSTQEIQARKRKRCEEEG